MLGYDVTEGREQDWMKLVGHLGRDARIWELIQGSICLFPRFGASSLIKSVLTSTFQFSVPEAVVRGPKLLASQVSMVDLGMEY